MTPITKKLDDSYLCWAWEEADSVLPLQLQSKPFTPLAAGEVLIANRAIGLNPVDCKMVYSGHAAWLPGHVPGVDGVGTIVAVGSAVNLPLGLRVAYHQSLARDGSFAHYTRLRAECLLPIPEGVSDIQAAAIPCPALTVWQALHKVPASGDRDVLVTGAGGAVGRILVQLALERGWRVWAVAGTPHHQSLLGLGALGVFDSRDSAWMQSLDGALGLRRLYAVFDTVSAEHARQLSPLLGYNSHLVCIQDRMEQAPQPAFTHAISLHEVALNSIYAHAVDRDWREWRAAGDALFSRVLRREMHLCSHPHLLDFEDIAQALAELRGGHMQGKCIALIDHQ